MTPEVVRREPADGRSAVRELADTKWLRPRRPWTTPHPPARSRWASRRCRQMWECTPGGGSRSRTPLPPGGGRLGRGGRGGAGRGAAACDRPVAPGAGLRRRPWPLSGSSWSSGTSAWWPMLPIWAYWCHRRFRPSLDAGRAVAQRPGRVARAPRPPGHPRAGGDRGHLHVGMGSGPRAWPTPSWRSQELQTVGCAPVASGVGLVAARHRRAPRSCCGSASCPPC